MTEKEYEYALKQIELLWHSADKVEMEEIDRLAQIIIKYEDEHVPMDLDSKW